VEAHINYTGIGTHAADGALAPTNNQFHLTGELTVAGTDNLSLGFILLSGVRPGGPGNLEYAGWRVLPYFYVPESWGLPLLLGLVTEFSFQQTVYEPNSRRVEVRPILEKSFGKFQFDFNPVFERALHGPDTATGWHFEPAARLAYNPEARFSPALEYYSSLGSLPQLSPLDRQFHQILPGGDLKISRRLVWSFGVGGGLTSEGSRRVYKTRLEFLFGKLDAK
jgi:hypothetical protein